MVYLTIGSCFSVHYQVLVYTTQVNSRFRVLWLANSEVISKVLFTSERPERNKMAARFASATDCMFLVAILFSLWDIYVNIYIIHFHLDE